MLKHSLHGLYNSDLPERSVPAEAGEAAKWTEKKPNEITLQLKEMLYYLFFELRILNSYIQRML